MSGKFEKAPLVYVSAKINTSPLSLTDAQIVTLSQAMIKLGLPQKQQAKYQSVEFNSRNGPIYGQDATLLGFFSSNKKEALLVDSNYIEWRTTNYDTFETMGARIKALADALIEAIEVYGETIVEEIELSYADLIYPVKNRTLGDYFKKGEGILPNNFLDNSCEDVICTGRIEIDRLISPKLRMTAQFEQLPFNQGRVHTTIPRNMLEHIPGFTMPIEIPYSQPNEKAKHYGVLGTSAGAIKNEKLKNVNEADLFYELHRLIDDAFKNLINRDVCDIDWEYRNEEKGNRYDS